MIPVQILKNIQNQNTQHRQTNSAFLKSRKHSPITHLIVTRHPRVSQQMKEQSNSPSTKLKTSTQYPQIIQSVEQMKRFPTEANVKSIKGSTIQISNALKLFSSKHPSDQQQNTLKYSSFIYEKVNEQSIYTKTTTGESQENDKVFNQGKVLNGNLDSFIVYNNVLHCKNLEIQKLEKELKQLKQENRKYQNLEKDYQTILQENQNLKLKVQNQFTEINLLNHQQTCNSLRKQSDYVSALSDQDKLKIKTLLECD
ncbi:unnamed protein product [Paramecium pentaurelia]|uniref:Uncharacterized protein n=1 Tax=Paramecium pentaurelia TaxID=43138 RepID=A0A8S1X4X3_9CILI|nr:unnamed protein product [Paramecium pentaurelia]